MWGCSEAWARGRVLDEAARRRRSVTSAWSRAPARRARRLQGPGPSGLEQRQGAESGAAPTQSMGACCLQVCLWRTEDFLVMFISSLNIGNKL